MPYPFIWHLVCFDVAIMCNLSAVVLCLCVFGNAFPSYSVLSFFNFIIFHSTLDDTYQTNFASCFNLFAFFFLFIRWFIVNVHVCLYVWVYARIFQLILDPIAFYWVCVCGCFFFVCFRGVKWLFNRKSSSGGDLLQEL